jgi:hypothetical protein
MLRGIHLDLRISVMKPAYMGLHNLPGKHYIAVIAFDVTIDSMFCLHMAFELCLLWKCGCTDWSGVFWRPELPCDYILPTPLTTRRIG